MDKMSVAVVAALAALLVVPSLALASDTTVVVTEADLQAPGPPGGTSPTTGWVKAIGAGQTIGDTPYINYVAGPRLPPMGVQSLHMQTGYDDADPLEKTYVGTNNHNTIPLADIVELKYSTFLLSRDYATSGTPLGQPPMLEITTDSGSSTQRRTFVYKPWGQYGQNNVLTANWQEWDCLAAGGRWELLHTSSTNYFGDWAWVKGRYPGLRIQHPLVGDYNDGTPAIGGITWVLNQSGTGIAIKIGSGKAQDSRYGAWWRESCGINAFADKLVIAYKERDSQGNETGNIIRYTYDFDVTPQPPLATNNRNAVTDPAALSVANTRMFVVYGKVLSTGYLANEYFTIDDGSAQPIRVYAKNHTITQPSEFDNFYVRAKGRMVGNGNPPALWSSAENIEMIPVN